MTTFPEAPPALSEEELQGAIQGLDLREQALLATIYEAQIASSGGLPQLLEQKRGVLSPTVAQVHSFKFSDDLSAARGRLYQVFGTKPLEQISAADFTEYFAPYGVAKATLANQAAVFLERRIALMDAAR